MPAPRPRKQLFRDSRVGLGPFRLRVVEIDRLSEGRRLAEADVPRHDGGKHFFPEMPADLLEDLAGEVRAFVPHRRDDPRDLEVGLRLSLTRSIVARSSETPSSAKYSHWMGTTTPSAAVSALTVRRPSEGGQSTNTKSNSRRSGSSCSLSRYSRRSEETSSISAPTRSRFAGASVRKLSSVMRAISENAAPPSSQS